MTNKTLLELRSEIKKACDLEEEDFAPDAEILNYINEGIDFVEATILQLHEDYFLTKANLTLVSGTEYIALPNDIYASKIRRLIYKNGNTIYEVKRLRDDQRYIEFEELQANSSGGPYSYHLENPSSGSASRIVLAPIPNESGEYLKLWYIRNAKRLANDSDTCDIPEFQAYIVQYAKTRIYEKESNPLLDFAVKVLERMEAQMVNTLSTMVEDSDDTIPMDLSHYQEHF